MIAPVHPETVGDLIENLKMFPRDMPLDFSPFSLYRVKDRGVCHEVAGVDFEWIDQPEE